MISKQVKRVVLASAVLALFSTPAFATEEVAAEAAAVADKAGEVADKACAKAGEISEKAAGLTKQAAALADKMVNINTADASTLAAIPGVGETLAQAITKYREMNGSFSQVKDLLNVDGINAELLEKITPFLKF